MPSDWDLISSDTRLSLSHEALRRAASAIADEAELLARDIERGVLDDRGGPSALRLLAALVRLDSGEEPALAEAG